MARACERVGILHMIEPRSARERARPAERHDPAVGAYLARVAAEIGADIVKVIHPGSREALAQVVDGCPAPVLLAGGQEAEDEERARALAEDAVAAGCRGLVFGRAIVRADDPAAALARFRTIIHGRT